MTLIESKILPAFGFHSYRYSDVKGEQLAKYLEQEKANRLEIHAIISDVSQS